MMKLFATFHKSTGLPIDLYHLDIFSCCYVSNYFIRGIIYVKTFVTLFDGINSLRGWYKNQDGYGLVNALLMGNVIRMCSHSHLDFIPIAQTIWTLKHGSKNYGVACVFCPYLATMRQNSQMTHLT